MDPNMMTIVIGAAIGGVSFFLGWFLNARSGHNKLSSAEERAKKILEDAEKEANTLKREKLVEAKDEWFKRKKDMEAELQSRRNKLQAYEKQIQNREENVERKLELLNKKESSVQQSERDIMDRQKRVADKELDLERLIEEEIHKLERISGVSREEAKKYLQENLLEQVKTESAVMMKEVRDNAKIDARREAQKIVVQALGWAGVKRPLRLSRQIVHPTR